MLSKGEPGLSRCETGCRGADAGRVVVGIAVLMLVVLVHHHFMWSVVPLLGARDGTGS